MSDLLNDIHLKKLDEVKALIQKQSKLRLIVMGIGLIIVVLLLFSIFGKPKENPVVLHNEREIELLKRNNALIDSLIKVKDTIYIENRKTETRIIREYEKIPVHVNSLDREQLRREVTNY